MMSRNIRLTAILLTASLLLLVPFIAMQFTNEVNWSLSDFIIAAILLFGTGLTCELVLRLVKTNIYRLLICAGIFLLLALVWIELAVGIFGTPFAGN